MNLYEKYRPQTLKEFRGNTTLVKQLNTLLENKEMLPNTFLIYGESGTGKTTIARIISNQINGDLREINVADFNGIDTIRQMREETAYRPLGRDYAVYLIDECHMLTKQAQEAILKVLESSPPYCMFILCTTEPQKLLRTVKNRCLELETKPLTANQMHKLISDIIQKENFDIEEKTIEKIIDISNGSSRKALQYLATCSTVEKELQFDSFNENDDVTTEIKKLCQLLLNKRMPSEVCKALKEIKEEPETVRRMILGYMNAVVLNSQGENLNTLNIIKCFSSNYYDSGKAGLTLSCFMYLKGK